MTDADQRAYWRENKRAQRAGRRRPYRFWRPAQILEMARLRLNDRTWAEVGAVFDTSGENARAVYLYNRNLVEGRT